MPDCILFFQNTMGVSNALLQTCCLMGICNVNKPERHFCKLPYFRWKTFQLDVWNQVTVLWTKSFWKYPSHTLDIIIFSETIWYKVGPQVLQGQANLYSAQISIPVPVSPLTNTQVRQISKFLIWWKVSKKLFVINYLSWIFSLKNKINSHSSTLLWTTDSVSPVEKIRAWAK